MHDSCQGEREIAGYHVNTYIQTNYCIFFRLRSPVSVSVSVSWHVRSFVRLFLRSFVRLLVRLYIRLLSIFLFVRSIYVMDKST